MMESRDTLHSEYLALAPSLSRLQKAMIEQLDHLVTSCGLTLGVPIESRIKSWDSIAEKLERKRLNPKSLNDIDDLLGLRVIFLFQRDLEPFHKAIGETFHVLSEEDTSHRLSDAQFGYKSRHYIASMPSEWDSLPSLKGLTAHRVEVQVRTLAQHIWAVASHKLQYKREEGVPLPLRRSIYRVSALLETVDLEFTRVLDERDKYIKTQSILAAEDDKLDVSIVETVLDELLPAENKDNGAEDYSDLLVDIRHFDIGTRGALRTLLSANLVAVLQADAELVQIKQVSDDEQDFDEQGESLTERLNRGVFYTHVGLARQALCEQFGDKAVRDWQNARDL